MKTLNWILERFFGVLGAFLGSQLPVFMQQYIQRLSGHITELNQLIEEIRKIAQFSGKSLDQYIQKFLASGDSDFVRQGEFMRLLIERKVSYSQTLNELMNSSALSKPLIFFKDINYEIANGTFREFIPGMTLNLEGIVYTCVGLIVGCLFYKLLAKFSSKFKAPRREHKERSV